MVPKPCIILNQDSARPISVGDLATLPEVLKGGALGQKGGPQAQNLALKTSNEAQNSQNFGGNGLLKWIKKGNCKGIGLNF